MPLKHSAIPEVPLGTPSKRWLDAIKETVEIWRGVRRSTDRKMDAVVTYQDLVDLGLIIEEQVPR